MLIYEQTRISESGIIYIHDGEVLSHEDWKFEFSNVKTPTAIENPQIQVWMIESDETFGFGLNDYVSWLKDENYIIDFTPISKDEPNGYFTEEGVNEMTRETEQNEFSFSELHDFDLLGFELISYFLDTEPVLDHGFE